MHTRADVVPRYIPGLTIEEVEREHGVRAVKLASNETCLGASSRVVEAIANAARSAHLYPEVNAAPLLNGIARRHAAAPGDIALGNGSTELITLLVRAVLRDGDALLNAWPSFVWYRLAAANAGRREIAVPLLPDLRYDLDGMARAAREPSVKLVFIANPNNPTGRGVDADELTAFAQALPEDVVLVIDDAYAEYRDDEEIGLRLARARARTVVLRTFSKAFGLAGLRIGYALGDPAVVAAIERLRDPFSTGSVAQQAACAALDDLAHVARAKQHNDRERPHLVRGLEARGFLVTPSSGNFVYARVADAESVARRLLAHGVIVRTLPAYGIRDALRVSVGTREAHERLFHALDALPASAGDPPAGH